MALHVHAYDKINEKSLLRTANLGVHVCANTPYMYEKIIYCAERVSANARPHQLCLGDREKVYYMSFAHVLCLIMSGVLS